MGHGKPLGQGIQWEKCLEQLSAALGGIWRRLGWPGWAFCPVPSEGQVTDWEVIGMKSSVFQEKGTVRTAAKEKRDLRRSEPNSWRRLEDFSREIIGNSDGSSIKSALESHKIPKERSGCNLWMQNGAQNIKQGSCTPWEPNQT